MEIPRLSQEPPYSYLVMSIQTGEKHFLMSRNVALSPTMLPLDASLILDALNDAVITIDPDMRITYCNRAAERLLLVEALDIAGKPCAEVLRSSACETACALNESLSCGDSVDGRRCTVRRSDGRQIPVSLSTSVLRDAQGATLGGVQIMRDLRQEEALREAALRGTGTQSLVAVSPVMRDLVARLPTIAASSVTVLISGESGTGKEVVAKHLHQASPRAHKPFIAINCAALPDNLLESELFGYKAGAFTDARHDKPGRFALADGGTLFLDEIGDMSPAMQVRLLRVLQERQFEPLGAIQPQSCNVRVIAASNRDLAQEVAEGRFRRDLYYRIAVIPVHIPPLRDRPGDAEALARHFLRTLASDQQAPLPELSDDVVERLRSHHWPGNVRELANAMERAWVLGHGEIDVAHLPGSGLTKTYRRAQTQPVAPTGTSAREQRHAQEAEMLLQALRHHGWNRKATADALGIHKTTLHRQLRKLGLRPPRSGDV
ncbi:MAG: PAS domain-containing protein [Planctomycetota bacterium]|nr:MAG: PAS domain-containing protein [Planctomycetota bacterium]